MIKQELVFNREYALNIKQNITPIITLVEKFRVGAWETVSRGTLINNLDNENTKRLLEIYRLTYDLNDTNANFIDTLIGLRAALGNVESARAIFFKKINADIDRLLVNLVELGNHNPKLVVTDVGAPAQAPVASPSFPKPAPDLKPADATAKQPTLERAAPNSQQPQAH
ncbi:hypothetical protein FV234_18350 [Methylobacterium sp. WL8]|nr:hypothetical protein FV234_18350 [Methylobacterium sp. WL8]